MSREAERRPRHEDGAPNGDHTTASVPADYVTLLQRRILVAVEDSRTAVADAYRRGRADGYDAGWLAAMAHIKRTDRELVAALRNRATVWSVRGQRRTRQTFADPHPRDYPGALP